MKKPKSDARSIRLQLYYLKMNLDYLTNNTITRTYVEGIDVSIAYGPTVKELQY